MKRSVYIGWDPHEALAFEVATYSLLRRLSEPIYLSKLVLADVRERGLYRRPTSWQDGKLIDILSVRDDYNGAMSTEHACARFCTPYLAKSGWALFMDGDVLVRHDIARIFDELDPARALYCVQHAYRPKEATKKGGYVQTRYDRKNWSSVMIFNCDHPSVEALAHVINKVPGRDLHGFCWLADSQIGALDASWNHLVGWSGGLDPRIVHFTEGLPDVPGYENCEYADEWRAERAMTVSGQTLSAAE